MKLSLSNFSMLYFLYAYAMHREHELTLDDVLLCPHAFSVLNYCLPCLAISIDKVGNILTGSFHTFEFTSNFGILCRDKFVGHLFPQVCNKMGTLHHLQGGRTIMLLLGGMTADTLCTILIVALAREVFVFINRHCRHSNRGGHI
uniref:Uncharacterized protein n=1 Tax=Podoviridae sp. ctDwO1 TaxID=2827726 RepID=A0A8S5TA88_9CAUD|nr:MAG TPA: hypothetical protein [Podoviridae sp. ctDwO1]